MQHEKQKTAATIILHQTQKNKKREKTVRDSKIDLKIQAENNTRM